MKDGLNAGLTKNFHVYLPLVALTVLTLTVFGYFWNND
jgi:hypothetical protein